MDRLKQLQEKEGVLARGLELRKGLPFLHGWKWYTWAREFFDNQDKVALLCAANQISKSSTQIRKCIDWATDKTKWPDLWENEPSTFWYFYPSMRVATVEFQKKWKQFLPTGAYKDDPIYGWRETYKNGEIQAIHFNSGVTVYFHAYSQDVMDLQSTTVDVVFCDEELPTEKYDELMVRLTATNGYFNMVFTATIGQDFWRRAMEPEAHEQETLPDAWKKEVSMYDCMAYDDGTPTQWTLERIKIAENKCKNDLEIKKRIYGKFVMDDAGRKYEQFKIARNMQAPLPVPTDWFIFAGVDIGSGGKENHPAAICFLAVRPDYQQGRVFLAWRGDGVLTTAQDVMDKFKEMRAAKGLYCTRQFYDSASVDFGSIAARIGEPFEKADKSHSKGEEFINVLFKNQMLSIDETEETHKLASELLSLRKETAKNKAKDDLCDAMRYAITSVPWDFSVITWMSADEIPVQTVPLTPLAQEIEDRRHTFKPSESLDEWDIQAEIEEWNSAYTGDT